MNSTDRTLNNALMRLHIMGCAEALHAAAMTDYLTGPEAEECLDRLDAINPHAFTLAKKYFRLPEEVECVVGDGWSYLRKTSQRYDAIAIDAFSSDGSVPEQFTGEDFYQAVRQTLNPLGVVVVNVMVEHDMDMLADRIALNMESANMSAALFDRPGLRDRNVIIAGGAVDHMRIASYRKPVWVRHELRGIIRRNAKRQAGMNSR